MIQLSAGEPAFLAFAAGNPVYPMQSREPSQRALLEPPFILALDIGTSSVRAGLFDRLGRTVPEVETSLAHGPESTPDGGVEMDPEGLVEAACWALSSASRAAASRWPQAPAC